MRRVLVIDDHEPSRKILRNTLLQDGYQIAGQAGIGNDEKRSRGFLPEGG
jgi:hypothetical protein